MCDTYIQCVTSIDKKYKWLPVVTRNSSVPAPQHWDWLSPIRPRNSASPTQSIVDKSTRFRCFCSLVSDTSLSNCTLYTVLEGPRSTTYLTLHYADHRQPGPDRPPKRGNGKITAARGSSPSTSDLRSRTVDATEDRPERPPSAPRRSHVIDQPAATACRRPGRPSAMGDRREPLGTLCGAGAGPRWSA